MSECDNQSSEDEDFDEGPRELIWYTAEFGGHSIYAAWDGYVFNIYHLRAGFDEMTWLGDAEDIEDVDLWALDVLSDMDVLEVSTDFHAVNPSGPRSLP
jgi:hypothetical protein